MNDLEKLERKVTRLENKIDALKTELDNMPERWRNKRSEVEDKIASLRSEKRSVNKEIKSISIVISKPVKNKEVKDEYATRKNPRSNNKNLSVNSYTARMEGDWSIRVYDSGFSTGKKGKDFLKASSENELLDKIKEYEEKAEEDEIRNENEQLKTEANDLTAKINKNSVLISKLKSKILNSNLKDKSVLEDSPVPTSTQISFSVMYPNRVRETNEQYKELIEHKNEVLANQEVFIEKLQSVADQIEEDSDDKFYSSRYENGNSKTAEERRANDSYRCDKCHGSIVKGSQYICLTIHGTTSQRIPKKLYGGRQYYRTIHSNATYRYHIGCYN